MHSVRSLRDLRTRLRSRPGLKYIISPSLLALFFSTIYLWYYFLEDYGTEPEVWNILPDHTLAPRLRPSEIMARPIASGDDMYSIPKYIHQSWMTDELPGKMTKWSQTCRAEHSHWNWVLWTDEDNLKMVETYFPWFLKTYRALPAEINRADACRNMYMYLFGGLYADLDVECLQPVDGLFHHHGISITDSENAHRSDRVASDTTGSQIAFFGRMAYDGDWTKYHVVPNAWMAASPGHPFFLLVLERLREAIEEPQKNKYDTTAEELTGPVALFHGIESYNSLLDSGTSFERYFEDNPSYHIFNRTSSSLRMELLPPENVYPFAWNHAGNKYRKYCLASLRRFNSKKCKEIVTTNQSYAITYWSHTWNEDLHKTHDAGRMDALKKGLGF